MTRQPVEDKSIQKSVYFKSSTWKRLERQYGYGKISANIEKIILDFFKDPDGEKKARLMAINKQLAEFNAIYGMNLGIYEEPPQKEAPPAPEEKGDD